MTEDRAALELEARLEALEQEMRESGINRDWADKLAALLREHRQQEQQVVDRGNRSPDGDGHDKRSVTVPGKASASSDKAKENDADTGNPLAEAGSEPADSLSPPSGEPRQEQDMMPPLPQCPRCGTAAECAVKWEEEQVPIGETLTATARVPVWTCNHCAFSWTDAHAESIRDGVVNEGLAVAGYPRRAKPVAPSLPHGEEAGASRWFFCEHANEVPSVCPCRASCICREDMCKHKAPALPERPAPPEEQDLDMRAVCYALTNVYTLARRGLRRSVKLDDAQSADYWNHIIRLCEDAGCRSQGVLRASLPTEMTDGSAALPPPAPPKEQA